jgi:hypothetical protein
MFWLLAIGFFTAAGEFETADTHEYCAKCFFDAESV